MSGLTGAGGETEEHAVRKEIVAILRERGISGACDLDDQVSLVADLGFDSLAFLDLGLRLERTLAVTDFAIQDWLTAESELAGAEHHTVGSLVTHARTQVGRGRVAAK